MIKKTTEGLNFNRCIYCSCFIRESGIKRIGYCDRFGLSVLDSLCGCKILDNETNTAVLHNFDFREPVDINHHMLKNIPTSVLLKEIGKRCKDGC